MPQLDLSTFFYQLIVCIYFSYFSLFYFKHKIINTLYRVSLLDVNVDQKKYFKNFKLQFLQKVLKI